MTEEFSAKKLLIGGACCLVVAAIVVIVEKTGVASGIMATSATSTTQQATAAAAQTSTSTATTAKETGIVNINTATIDELQMLSGIGPAKAQAIIDHRGKTPFYQPEDLMQVKGIGKAIFASLKDHITVGDITPPPASSQSKPATRASPAAKSAPPPPAPILPISITAVMAGTKNDLHAQYIELFNNNGEPVDLSGWSIKKKSAGGSVTVLVAASHFNGKIIPPGKHFLIASATYSGLASDLTWPASYSLASKDNAIMLYARDNSLIDSASWKEIPVGKSLTRASGTEDFSLTDPSPHNSTQ